MSGQRIEDFDTYKVGYGGASVTAYLAGTTTLASLYFDEALTSAAPNPVKLLSRSFGGVNFGKFAAPIYCGQAIELHIGPDQSGVIRPFVQSLDGEDASAATVNVAGEDIPLSEILARWVHVSDYGEFLPTSSSSDSASTNNATIELGIAAASAAGGGYVMVPEGTFLFTDFTIPAGVILKGAGKDVTVLQSQVADKVVTLGGDASGFEDITFDGVDQQAGSIGLYTKAQDSTRIRRAKMKRFESGVSAVGGRKNDWVDFDIDTATSGGLLRGNLDGSGGDDWMHNRWTGHVTNCTSVGVELKYVDRKCWHNRLDIGFETNVGGVALRVYGARHTDISGAWFSGNTADFEFLDGADTSASDENTIIGFVMRGGSTSGNWSATGKMQDVIFQGVEIGGGTITLNNLENTILALDCLEDDSVTLAGTDSTKWTRARSILGDAPGSFGLTTDATATEAWAYELDPGERVILEAKIIANGKNVNDYATYHIERAAHRPGSTLAYDGQTVNFTAGKTVTGQTSGATALIITDADSGATGTLTLRDIEGEFIDDETIIDGAGGTAIANGTLTHQNAALLDAGLTSLKTASETDATFDAVFGVTAHKVRVMVTGAAGKTVEWTVSVQVVSG